MASASPPPPENAPPVASSSEPAPLEDAPPPPQPASRPSLDGAEAADKPGAVASPPDAHSPSSTHPGPQPLEVDVSEPVPDDPVAPGALEGQTSPPPLAPPAHPAPPSPFDEDTPPDVSPPGLRPAPPDEASDAVEPRPDDIRAAIVHYLTKKQGQKGGQLPPPTAASADAPSRALLLSPVHPEPFIVLPRNIAEVATRLGLYLRSRGLAPHTQLKRFILQHCEGVAVFNHANTGAGLVQLAEAAAAEAAAAEREEAPTVAAAAAPPAYVAVPADPSQPASSDNFDPSWLEQRLLEHCVELHRSGVQLSLPTLGEFCSHKLGLQMKGKLRPFLEQQPQLFELSDDIRQLVSLTPAGAILAEGTPMPPSPPPRLALLNKADAAPATQPVATGGTLPGGGGGSGPTHAASRVVATVVPAASAAKSTAKDYPYKDYKKWDSLTKEIYQFVRARGAASFSQIDAHVRAHCARHVQGTGVPLAQWRSQIFLHKRRNIFCMQGTSGVSLISGLRPEAPPAPAGNGGAAAPTPQPPPDALQPLPRGGSDTAAATPPQQQEQPGAAWQQPGGGGNPLLAAFVAERRLLEELRDEVHAKLASLRALSELQRENSGLRAACVTLGHEMLSLKAEFGAFKQQMAAALAGHDLPVQTPSWPEAEAAAGRAQQVYWGFAGDTSAGSTPRHSTRLEPRHAEAGALQQPLAGVLPVPMHLPAGSPRAAAGRAAPLRMPPGQIALVGGHDGGTWLDEVDSFSPSEHSWASLPGLGAPRSFAAAACAPGKLFVLGGGNGVDWFDSVLRYDRVAGLVGGWQELAPLSVARGSLAAATAGGYLFTYGGGTHKQQYDVVEWYDPHSNRWLRGPPLTRKRFALGGAELGGALHAVGGYDGVAYLACVERLDPRTDSWEVLPATMASRRGGHAVAAAAGALYALGGFDSTQAVRRCEVLETRMQAWRPIADMADTRAYGSCAVLAGTLFAVGGLQSDMQTHAALVEAYNPAVDGWEPVELPSNANPRRSFLAACGLE